MGVVKWTETAIREEAAKYSSKAEFFRSCQSAYQSARGLGLLDELFENQYRYWDEQSIREEAAKYSSRVEFVRGRESAYDAARTRFPGLLDELFPENDYRYTDADAFYIWRAGHCEWQGQPVYKFGLTSQRCGMARIKACASANKVRATGIKLFHSETAALWEEIFHSTFTVIPDLGFQDGKTEFRACNEADLANFLAFIGEELREAA